MSYVYMEFMHDGVRCSCSNCVHKDVVLPGDPCAECFSGMCTDVFSKRNACGYEPKDPEQLDILKKMIEKYRKPLLEMKEDLQAHGISVNELVVYQLGIVSNSMYI